MEINIIVRDKIASGDGTWIVCGNSDYIVRFTLDSEWDQFITRTMIVVNADKTYQEVVFTGDTAALPVINNQKSVSIGLYAGDLHTTTSAYFNCKKSARDGLGEHEEPSKDVYNQLVQLVENGAVKGDKGDKTYLHIAYANSEDGETDFTTSPVSDKVYTYLGQYSDYTPEDSTVPSTYVWSKLTEEAERAAAELIRVAAEEERVAAETARVSAESQRDSAESNRNIAEETRVSNESARKTAEISRVSAENTRYTSETSRVNAETSRVNAETIRVSAENERVAEWSEIKSDVQSSVGSAVASASAATDAANIAAENANAIVPKLCTPFEASGSVVTCHPVEGYPLGVVSRIDAVQEGTGDSSPDNVRAIIGWDAVTLNQSNDGVEEKTYNITLPETVYGGTLDWTTGVLTVDHAIATLDGTEKYFHNTGWANKYAYTVSNILIGSVGVYDYATIIGLVCSHVKEERPSIIAGTAGKIGIGLAVNNTLLICLGDYASDQINDYIAEQYAAGTPIRICYKLAEPYTIQLTPQQILAISGTNTLYTDSGGTTVSGPTDPVWMTQQMMDRIAALESVALSE